MASWPSQLPDYLLVDENAGSYGDNTIRSQTDVGPVKLRRRSTSTPDLFSGVQYLTTTQLGYLKTFYKTTLSDGSIQFTWKDPVTRSSAEMIFMAPPSYSNVGGVYWKVNYQFSILP